MFSAEKDRELLNNIGKLVNQACS